MTARQKWESPAATEICATHENTDRLIVPQPGTNGRYFATLRAQFALRGHRLERSTHGFYAEKWGMVRWLADLPAAQQFLIVIGGAQ